MASVVALQATGAANRPPAREDARVAAVLPVERTARAKARVVLATVAPRVRPVRPARLAGRTWAAAVMRPRRARRETAAPAARPLVETVLGDQRVAARPVVARPVAARPAAARPVVALPVAAEWRAAVHPTLAPAGRAPTAAPVCATWPRGRARRTRISVPRPATPASTTRSVAAPIAPTTFAAPPLASPTGRTVKRAGLAAAVRARSTASARTSTARARPADRAATPAAATRNAAQASATPRTSATVARRFVHSFTTCAVTRVSAAVAAA